VLVARAVLEPAEHHPRAWAELTGTWLLMVLAMMVPLQRFSIRVAATRSLWRRRDRAIGGFLLGYLSPWLLLGAGVAALEPVLTRLPGLTAAGFAVAAVWQLTPVKARALRACHRSIPLAPHGWRADQDCCRFGWLTGTQCLLSCWALMLACVLAGHSLAAMLCASGVGVAERYVVQPRQQGRTFSPLLGVALVYGILGLSALQFG
jgi:predicted metal-binding membrane protein